MRGTRRPPKRDPEPDVMSIADQIADLGAQFQAAILNAYTSIPAGGLEAFSGQPLLAFLPGDIPVPVDTFVQATGAATSTVPGNSGSAPTQAINPLLVSMWLKSDGAGADAPLLIQTDQNTVISGPPGGFTTMSEMYFDLLSFANPLAAVGSPEANVLAQELTWARETLPQSANLMTLSTQPSDWALPSSNYWSQFSYTYTPPAPSSNGGTTAPVTPPIFVPPSNIWRLRTVVDPVRQPVSAPVHQTANLPVGRQMALVGNTAPSGGSTVGTPILSHLSPMFLAAMNASTVATTAAAAPASQVSMEHMLVSIDRSSWWQNDWLIDQGWYVPGESRGTAISPTSSAEQTWAIPVAMVLVQNLVMTGSWSTADVNSLIGGDVMFGPFHLGAATVAPNASNTLSITVAGPSLVAFFCQPLVVLPPSDPPTTPTPSSTTTAAPSSAAGQQSPAPTVTASATPGSAQSSA
jgi:hypothetical protein